MNDDLVQYSHGFGIGVRYYDSYGYGYGKVSDWDWYLDLLLVYKCDINIQTRVLNYCKEITDKYE